MKKLTDKILATTADAALEALLAAAGLASVGGAYQPAEPKNLKKVAANRKKLK
ncbi:MAG: cyclic lactone autoinducer peptide [Clostridia bacterium]|nr:cyclic lactone autoinducer peptide [Clostridia bacterium]